MEAEGTEAEVMEAEDMEAADMDIAGCSLIHTPLDKHFNGRFLMSKVMECEYLKILTLLVFNYK